MRIPSVGLKVEGLRSKGFRFRVGVAGFASWGIIERESNGKNGTCNGNLRPLFKGPEGLGLGIE